MSEAYQATESLCQPLWIPRFGCANLRTVPLSRSCFQVLESTTPKNFLPSFNSGSRQIDFCPWCGRSGNRTNSGRPLNGSRGHTPGELYSLTVTGLGTARYGSRSRYVGISLKQSRESSIEFLMLCATAPIPTPCHGKQGLTLPSRICRILMIPFPLPLRPNQCSFSMGPITKG